jgi:error-prone DNA polymerase
MGFYAPHVLVGDARRHKIPLMRVAINSSSVRCTPSDGRVLLGLATVRSLSEEMAGAIVAERDANGSYRSLADLLRRTGLPHTAAQNLISIGGLGEFGLSRRELLWQLGLLMPRSGTTGTAPSGFRHSARSQRQLTLMLPTEQDMAYGLKDMDDWERMVADYGLLQLSPSFHPLGLLRTRLPSDVLTTTGLRAVQDGQRVRIAGLVVCRQRPRTAAGFLFILLEDETGLTNVVVRPDLYEAERSVLRGEPYLYVEGTVQLRSKTLNLLAERVSSMAELPGVFLPSPRLRHPYPGNPNDPREAAPVLVADGSGVATSDRVALDLATPASHDFR